MSSGPLRNGGQPPKGAPPSSQAILLDKLHGRSTPDSEALASSDDEPDQARQVHQPPMPARRGSWLDNTSQVISPSTMPRKGSFASNSMSPTTSLPPTPSGENGATAWGSLAGATLPSLNRAVSGSGSSYPWGTASGIWNNDRKDASSRLAEVMPSPTTATPPGNGLSGMYNGDSGQDVIPPGSSRDQTASSQIPFPFPLEPSIKTLRSSSYSACQRGEDSPPSFLPLGLPARNRPFGGHNGLQHRPSRPSMLSEVANDGSALGKVNEDEDDDNNGPWMSKDQQQKTIEQMEIENLKRENASLRRQQEQLQQQQQQQQQQRLRPRASTGAASAYGLNSAFQEPVLEEGSDYAVDVEETNDVGPDMIGRRVLSRRMSEFGGGHLHSAYSAHEKRKHDNVKMKMWQTSLGFNGVGDGLSQSRRHSFADGFIPQRQNSLVSSMGDSIDPLDQMSASQESQGQYSQEGAYSALSESVSNFAAAKAQPYYAGNGGSSVGGYGQVPAPYGSYANRSVSPPQPRSMYAMQHGAMHPRPHQPLYIVLFKCVRPEVFYIQEGTGLSVKPGDLVIVEADRGTDLGTVARDNVDWQAAKELKDHYLEEHYKWLMMYSATAASDGAYTGAGLMAASNGASAVGGMGPPNPHHMQEPANGELKPKLIKRLAQQHEVLALRDKEGQEAKAKRVCQQKVKEHNLNMEILDAEFQMDWKKLTFYYFADAYINFNPLVTDLFKIYKTRIWMSAINPASFASGGASLGMGLQPPSGIGPGAIGHNISPSSQDRRQSAASPSDRTPVPSATSPNPGQNGHVARPGLRSSNSHSSFNETGSVMQQPTVYNPTANYAPYPVMNNMGPYASFGAVPRPVYGQMMQSTDNYAMGMYAQPNDYHTTQLGRGRFADNSPDHGQTGQGFQHMGSQQDMYRAFQGLSLNGQR